MFKRAAAKAPPQGPPPDQAPDAASAQPPAQEASPQSVGDRGASDGVPSNTPDAQAGSVRSPGQREAAQGNAAKSGEGGHTIPLAEGRQGSQDQPGSESPLLQLPNSAGASLQRQSLQAANDVRSSRPASDAQCNIADRPDAEIAAAGQTELGRGATDTAGVRQPEQSQHPHTRDPGDAGPPGHPDADVAATPCQPPGGVVSSGPAGGAAGAQPECDLTSVDVDEQKRIMREIWLRGQGNAGRPGSGDVGGESASAPAVAGDRSAKRGRVGTAGSGNGAAAKESASKQMRISAMFKAPKKA